MRIQRLFPLLFLFAVASAAKEDEEEESEGALEQFSQSVGGLLDLFEVKRVTKQQEELVSHPEAISRNKFLSERLSKDMNFLRNSDLISNPEAGKLFAILENIEAIEANLRMAMHHEVKANQACSVFFMGYEELRDLPENQGANALTFITRHVDNFRHVNFEQVEGSGLFVTKELSRHGDFAEDVRQMSFVLNNMGNSMVTNAESMLLKRGSFGTIYALQDDADDEFAKKVIKVMTFRNSFMRELIAKMDAGTPVLDMLLFVVEKKRTYFEQVHKEIRLNARLNQFKVIDHTEVPGHDPASNSEAVNFFGCLNIRWKLNHLVRGLAEVFKLLKRSYSQLIATPADVRDLRIEDLSAMLQGKAVDLSRSRDPGGQEIDRKSKMLTMVHFLMALGVYQDYQYIAVLERLDIDLFDDMFQKIYFLDISSLEERLDVYINLTKKVQTLHSRGFNHCDLKMTNILYNIIPEHGFFNLNHSRFRLIDYGMVQGKTRFCQGGTIGYLSPEVEYPLRLPHFACDFMALLRASPGFDQAAFSPLLLDEYAQLQKSLLEHFGAVLPEDYVDLRIFFADVSLVLPQSADAWLELFRLLTPVFESLDVVARVNYRPTPDDVDVASKKLKVSVQPTLKLEINPRANLLSKEDIRKKLGAPVRTHTAGPIRVNHAEALQVLKGQPALKPKDDSFVQARRDYNRRFQLRKAMLEGSIDYPPDLIAPLNSADIFSLGILFVEIETVLNSNSIFNGFSAIAKEDFSLESVEAALGEPIKSTFALKTHRSSLTSAMRAAVEGFFKSEQDMSISFNQYSSEAKLIFSAKMKDFLKALNALRDLLLAMTAFYAQRRPGIDSVLQTLEALKKQLKAVQAGDSRYKNSISSVNRKIRSTSATFLQQRYTSIYGQLRRERLLV